MDNTKSRSHSLQSTEVGWQPYREDRTRIDTDVLMTLRQIPLFRDIPASDWRELTDLFHLRTFEDCEVIFEYGTPGLGMYVVIDGRVRIVGRGKVGEVEFGRLGAGEFFGEMSLVNDITRNAAAFAIGQTRLIGLFRPHLSDYMHRHPKLGLTLMEGLARIVVNRLLETDRQLAECRDQLNDLGSL